MQPNIIYRSPVICYEISKHNNAYQIDVYIDGHKNSLRKDLHCVLKDFSEDESKARHFALVLSQNAALPVHVPELAEEYLSI